MRGSVLQLSLTGAEERKATTLSLATPTERQIRDALAEAVGFHAGDLSHAKPQRIYSTKAYRDSFPSLDFSDCRAFYLN